MQWINPVEGIVTSLYGARLNPITHEEALHDGIDIGADTGTATVAIQDGTITSVGESQTYGIFIKYQTNDKREIMYAHLSGVAAQKGDSVKKGDTIGYVGSTGSSTGPHLHYSLWVDGKLTDPLPYVTLPYSGEVVSRLAEAQK